MTAISNTIWPWLLASGLLACLTTWLSLHYARRANLVDMPGQRRSHDVPTPRGGGIGIVVAVLAGLCAAGILFPGSKWPLLLIVAVTMVALVGWIDDHQPLPAWVRLLVHFLASLIWLAPLIAAIFFRHTDLDISTTQAIILFALL
ncbi:MAG TPA: lipopolysaccharide biosynthesis protein, partial [Rudaea sp.]|nr:lipopolysaccharide biosynthesis protein [Rudaea sp.]